MASLRIFFDGVPPHLDEEVSIYKMLSEEESIFQSWRDTYTHTLTDENHPTGS